MTETTQKGPTGAEIRKLVERGQKGDRTALEELYLIHFDRIYSYLHMTVGNRHDAEDLTTQTFLRMLETIGKFLAGHGPGMHHVAYQVDDVRSELSRLSAAGASLIDEEPRVGLFGLQVAFVHPDAVHGVLTEVVSVG